MNEMISYDNHLKCFETPDAYLFAILQIVPLVWSDSILTYPIWPTFQLLDM